MSKVLPIGALLILIICCCSSEPKKPVSSHISVGKGKVILIGFSIDDSTISLRDDFFIDFVSERESIAVLSKNNALILPIELEKHPEYTVVFRHGNYSMAFKGITRHMIFSGQDVGWDFGIDHYPFDEPLGLLSVQEYESNTTIKKLEYLQLNPMEEGDGIQFVNKISR